MDDFENTFFNLSSTPQFSLCSTSTNSNSNGSTSSLPTATSAESANLLQTQADDLEAMLLPHTAQSSQNINSHAEDDIATLLDNLPDEPSVDVGDDSEHRTIDSILGQDSSSAIQTSSNPVLSQGQSIVLEQSKPKTNVVVKSEHVSSSNMVQLKIIKPIIGLSSSSIANAAKMIPITVHSLTGQKHSIVHTVMPVGTPCVRVLPAGSQTLFQQNIIKQELLEEKVGMLYIFMILTAVSKVSTDIVNFCGGNTQQLLFVCFYMLLLHL